MTSEFHDHQAEEAALAAALANPNACGYLVEHCGEADFGSADRKICMRALTMLQAAGRPVDTVTVRTAISEGAKPEDVARLSEYVGSLSELFVVVANVSEYVASIVGHSVKRRAIRAGQAIEEAALRCNGDVADLPGRLEVIMADAVGEMRRRGGPDSALGPRSYTALEIDDMAFPEIDAVVLYAERGCTFDLVGKAKKGKTTFMLHACRAALAGEPFVGIPTKHVAILYLTEQTRRSFRDKLKAMGLAREADLHVVFRSDFVGKSWNEVCEFVRGQVAKWDIGLLVVDTLSDWAQIVDENDNAEALRVTAPLREVAEDGVAVATVRHAGKGDHGGTDVVDMGRGASAFAGAADVACVLEGAPGSGHANRRQLRFSSRKDGVPSTMIVELKDGHYDSLGDAPNVEYRVARDFVLEYLQGSKAAALTEKDILEACDDQFSRRTLQRVMNGEKGVGGLIRDGIVAQEKAAGSASDKAFGYWLLNDGELGS